MNSLLNGKLRQDSFNTKLVKIRVERTGMSQTDFARYLEMEPIKYMEIERLQRYPTENEATWIADILDTNVYELFPKWNIPVYDEMISLFGYGYYGNNECRIYYMALDAHCSTESKIARLLIDEDTFAMEFKREINDAVNRALNQLKLKFKQIIEWRYGINGKSYFTLEEIGKKFGVSRERVRQWEKKAIQLLRYPSRSLGLRDFLNVHEYFISKENTHWIKRRQLLRKLNTPGYCNLKQLEILIDEGKELGISRERIMGKYRKYNENIQLDSKSCDVDECDNKSHKHAELLKQGLRRWGNDRLFEWDFVRFQWIGVKNTQGEDVVRKQVDGKWVTNE